MLLTSDRPRDGNRAFYPQLDEYRACPLSNGLLLAAHSPGPDRVPDSADPARLGSGLYQSRTGGSPSAKALKRALVTSRGRLCLWRTDGLHLARDGLSPGRNASMLPETTLPLLPARWETERLLVEDAALEDAPRLTEIFNACSYAGPWDRSFHPVPVEDLEHLLGQSLAAEGPDRFFRLQRIRPRDEDETAGYFHLTHGLPHPETVWISMFVLHPEHQRQHYGREAAAALAERLREHGYACIRLEVFLKNWPALRFWIAQGFTTIVAFDGDHVHTSESYASLELEKPLR
jgi:diamine N-acetyltransferase